MRDEVRLMRPIAQAMRAGKGKVMVGAGLSMQSGLGSWASVLRAPLKADLGIELAPADDLPEIAQFYADSVHGGRSRLVAAVASDVARAVPPSPAHLALGRLPVSECWTTNFDSLLEATFPNHCVVEDDAALVTESRGHAPLLVKMHGSLPTPKPTAEQIESVVLTRDDFDHYQERHPRLWSRIAANYLSGSMLFLGLSLTDPNMRVLQRLARAAQESGVDSSSVVVMKTPNDDQERLRFEPRVADLRRSGVSVMALSSYNDLVGLLERLRAKLRPPRVIISGSTTGLATDQRKRAISAARLLGSELAQAGIPIANGGSDIGAALARRMAETADLYHAYDPTLITTVRRRMVDGTTYIGYPAVAGAVGMPRDGTLRFMGATPKEMRDELTRLGCVAAVLGGTSGTMAEVAQFGNSGLPIVPWPATDGTAAALAPHLEKALEHVPGDQRAPIKNALHGNDLAIGAKAMAMLLRAIQAPHADTGPIDPPGP